MLLYSHVVINNFQLLKLFDLTFRRLKDGFGFNFTKVNTSIKNVKFSLNYFSISVTFLLWKTSHASSTYKNRLHLTAVDISLMQTKSSKGPSIDLRNTLHDILKISKKKFSKFTVNLRFDRFNSMNRKTNNKKCLCIMFKIISCLIASHALRRSIKVIHVS